MKITLVISNIIKCGGTERAATNLINYLAATGYDVSVISLFSRYGEAPFFILNESVAITHLNISEYENKSSFHRLKGFIRSVIALRKVLRSDTGDIVIGTSRNTNVLSLMFKKSYQKIVGCEHFAHNAPMNKWIKKIRDFSYRRLDRLVVLTSRDKEYYESRSISVEIIPNAVYFNVKEKNLVNNKSKIALAIGRHSKEKAFDKLIRLWKVIEDKRPEWNLNIIGEGDLLEYNKGIAARTGCRNIHFFPFQNNIQKFYEEASLYLMTSLYEALPMVLIEAKIHGCVNISYDCETGPREIIKNGVDGFLIPFDDEDTFISSVVDILDHPEKLFKMQENSIQNGKIYSPDMIMPNWTKLLNGL